MCASGALWVAGGATATPCAVARGAQPLRHRAPLGSPAPVCAAEGRRLRSVPPLQVAKVRVPPRRGGGPFSARRAQLHPGVVGAERRAPGGPTARRSPRPTTPTSTANSPPQSRGGLGGGGAGGVVAAGRRPGWHSHLGGVATPRRRAAERKDNHLSRKGGGAHEGKWKKGESEAGASPRQSPVVGMWKAMHYAQVLVATPRARATSTGPSSASKEVGFSEV